MIHERQAEFTFNSLSQTLNWNHTIASIIKGFLIEINGNTLKLAGVTGDLY